MERGLPIHNDDRSNIFNIIGRHLQERKLSIYVPTYVWWLGRFLFPHHIFQVGR